MPDASPDPGHAVQEMLKCKWAILILGAITDGHARPSSIERSVTGLSHKVLHQRLAKLTRLRIVQRIETASKMQQVEYHLTDFGRAIGTIIGDIQRLKSQYPSSIHMENTEEATPRRRS